MTSGMVSPFAGSFRGSGRFRNVSPFRARGNAVGQWNPNYLQPYAWYDTAIGQPRDVGYATFGGGSDGVSCTAPSGTASYSASPRGGGAASTGAASPGAFSFVTAGDWVSVSLLNGSAVEVAKWTAADSYADGMTDSFSVVWTLTVPRIYDRSANARAPIVSGTSTAAPTVLSWKGVSYVYLAAATAGTNSVSCTAPSGTASYSAVPEDGGSPSTGAASPGAFSFTTAGKWRSISLLDSGAVEVARYDAASSARTGHTDSYGVAWTVNRGTAGKKSAVLSNAAGTAFTVWQYDGVANVSTVPAAAFPAIGTSDIWTWVMVATVWATPAANADIIGKHTAYSGASNPGVGFGTRSTAGFGTRLKDGTVSQIAGEAALSSGRRDVFTSIANASTITHYQNNALGWTGARTVGDMTNANVGQIGRSGTSGTFYLSMVHRAWVPFQSELSLEHIAQFVNYYAGGF